MGYIQAHDTLTHHMVSNLDCAGMDLRVGGREPKPATRKVALREWVQGHDKDSEPLLIFHFQGLSTLKRFAPPCPPFLPSGEYAFSPSKIALLQRESGAVSAPGFPAGGFR